MTILLYNSYSGKREAINDFFPNKRKEYLRKFETFKDDQIKSWLQVTMKEILGEIDKNEKLIEEVETGVNKSENPPFNKSYVYEPSLEGYNGLLEFLKYECSIRYPDVYKEIFENIIKTKEEKSKGLCYPDGGYYIWIAKKQRLVDTVFLLRKNNELDKNLNDSQLSDMIIKKFRFETNKNITKSNLTTKFNRALTQREIRNFNFDEAREVVLSILIEDKN